MESNEARMALEAVTDAESRAAAPRSTGFAAALAILFGVGVTVAVMNLFWWTLGVMTALVVSVIGWLFPRRGVRDSARQPVDTSTGADWRRWPAFLPVMAVPVANLLPPIWWLAVLAGAAAAAPTLWVATTFKDVYFP